MDEKARRQRELDFMEAERAREIHARARALEHEIDRNIIPVVEQLGPKHFAELLGLGVAKQDRVYHWTERRNGQRPPAELLARVHEASEKAMNEYLNARGYEPTRRKLPASGDVLARAYEDKLRGFGEQGEKAIADARVEAAKPEPREWEQPLEPVRRIQ
jgi:hypothetical protein